MGIRFVDGIAPLRRAVVCIVWSPWGGIGADFSAIANLQFDNLFWAKCTSKI